MPGGFVQEAAVYRLPVVFGASERPITGIYHPPAELGQEGSQRGRRSLGVVLCNPLGYEAMSAHRTYRHFAERLAARSFAALRFDYGGTGNSPYRGDEPDRVEEWLANIAEAIAELRRRSGGQRIALFGVRFGGTLATLAAARDGDIECLVSWAPVVSGRAHVRELRALRLFKKPPGEAPQRTDAGEEVGGYLFAKQTLADMAEIDLLAGSGRVARRVLLLARAQPPLDEKKLAAHLEARGASVRLDTETGFAGMMRDDPYETVVPISTLDSIIDWLGEAANVERSDSAPSVTDEPRALAVVTRNPQRLVSETHLLFGADQRLFGVVTEPELVASDKPALLFLNVGANHNVGPHRMNVRLAREAAERGHVALRLDVSGLGDSPAERGRIENRIYTMDTVADVRVAMDFLTERSGVTRFILVGLCSGAYLAYHSAATDSRVCGQILLSPYAFEWQEGDPVTPTARESFRSFKSNRFYARALFDREVWLRALRGEVNHRAVGSIILERARARFDAAVPSLMARVRRQRAPVTNVERVFRSLCERGVESLLVLSFMDGGLDMVARYLGDDARRMRGYDNFSLHVIDDADHTFTTIASQEKLTKILADYLTTHFP
jgi:alpha-beta hydrolase superfamily lysophospholipase